MSSANENEFNVFGIAKGLRGGILTFFLALQTVAIVALFWVVMRLYGDKDQIREEQRKGEARLYEKMIDNLAPARDKMNQAADRAISSSNQLDSLANSIKIQPK